MVNHECHTRRTDWTGKRARTSGLSGLPSRGGWHGPCTDLWVEDQVPKEDPMRLRYLLTLLAAGLTAQAVSPRFPAGAQEYDPYTLEARVWLDRGAEPVLQRGERVRLYYRVSDNAFVAIFHIDTNGSVRMVFPSSPQENHYARGGRDYRILFPGSSYWYVADDPGVGYYFIVASPEPFDFREFGYSHFAGGWDLSHVGRQVYGDPYLAMDDYVATLIPDWEYVGYGLDFTSYHVERHYDYPRFMCYDCHGFQPYHTWNPYAYSCTSFRVIIYNDPYYYPATRYRGTRVVYAQPRRGVAHFGFKERAAGEPGTPHVVVRTPPAAGQPGVAGTSNRRAVPRSGASSLTGQPGTTAGSSRTGAPGVEGTANRRTGTSRTAVPSPSARGNSAEPGNGSASSTRPGNQRTDPAATRVPTSSTRPVLERRPVGSGTGSAGAATRPPAGTTVPRPSSRVRKPGGGGGVPIRANPTIRSGGSSTRTNPAVRNPGSVTRTSPTVGRGTTTSRPRSNVGTRGSTSRSNPVVRTPARTNTKVKRPGSGGTTPPRTVKPPPRRKPRKPPGSGGGGGGG